MIARMTLVVSVMGLLAGGPAAWGEDTGPAGDVRGNGSAPGGEKKPAARDSDPEPVSFEYLFTMEKINPRRRVARAWGASEGLAIVEHHGKWGFIDTDGDVVIQPRFDWAGDFHGGLAWVEIDGKCGYIDRRGQVVIEAKYERATGFRDGLAFVKTGGRWGCIDGEGRVVIPAVFSDAASFAEGLAAVKIGGRWGFVGRDGKMAIHPRFDHVWSFSEGLARVELGGVWGYVDKKGKTVWTGTRPGGPPTIILRGPKRPRE